MAHDDSAVLVIRKVLDGLRAAAQTQDLDAVRKCFHPDGGIFHPGKEEVKGIEAILERARKFVSTAHTEIASEILEASIEGNMALAYGVARREYTDRKTGKVSVEHGRFFLVFRKSATEDWQIYWDIDQAAPESFIRKG